MATVRTRIGRDGKPHYDVRFRDPNGVQRKRSFGPQARRDGLRRVRGDRQAARGLRRPQCGTGNVPHLRGPLARRSALRTVDKVESRLGSEESHLSGSGRQAIGVDPAEHGPGVGPVAVSSGAEHAAPDLRIRGDDPGRRRSTTSSWLATRPGRRRCAVPARTDPRSSHGRATASPAMAQALPDRYSVVVSIGAGLGLRQGEIFGLAVEDIDFLRREVIVRRQVQIVGAKQVFAPPKYGKERSIPLATHENGSRSTATTSTPFGARPWSASVSNPRGRTGVMPCVTSSPQCCSTRASRSRSSRSTLATATPASP
jgi:hypothetical protein